MDTTFWEHGAIVRREFKLLGRVKRPGTTISAETLSKVPLKNLIALRNSTLVEFKKVYKGN